MIYVQLKCAYLVVELTMLRVCGAVDVGVLIDGAVEQGCFSASVSVVVCILKERMTFLFTYLVLTYIITLKLKYVHYWFECWHTL